MADVFRCRGEWSFRSTRRSGEASSCGYSGRKIVGDCHWIAYRIQPLRLQSSDGGRGGGGLKGYWWRSAGARRGNTTNASWIAINCQLRSWTSHRESLATVGTMSSKHERPNMAGRCRICLIDHGCMTSLQNECVEAKLKDLTKCTCIDVSLFSFVFLRFPASTRTFRLNACTIFIYHTDQVRWESTQSCVSCVLLQAGNVARV